MRWHEGISSGPLVDETSGTIPAGSLGPVTLQVSATLTCGGQIDTKAVFTANGDGRGRVAAPYISLDICNGTTTTTGVTTTTTATSTTTSVPGSSTSAPVGSTSPSTAGSSVAQSSVPGSLPTTGGGRSQAALVALVTLAAGAGILAVTRRRRDEEPI
jgi:LPXTG-motif cell wall-anchored protein